MLESLREKWGISVACVVMAVLVGCASVEHVPTSLPAGETAARPTVPATTVPAITVPATTVPTVVPTTTLPVQETAEAAPTLISIPTVAVVPESVIEVPGAVLPPGFSMIVFADVYRPTALAFDENGRLYATSFDGSVHVLWDENGDGRAESDTVFYSGLQIPLGVTVHAPTGDVYVSSNGRISVLRDTTGDFVADEAENFVQGLPTGLHQNDNLKFGPDGWLYLGVGSTCDACVEADPRSASIMRFDIETGESEIFATGMRNPYDLAFHPETGALFATDNGRDDLGDDEPPEELNHIVQGGDYGWPDCWGAGLGGGCAGTKTAVALFESHASANGVDFYTGTQFPAAYQQNAFVAILGSWLVDRQQGIARVQLQPEGESYRSEVSWFAQWNGRPLGLIVGPDGAIYAGDYENGAIYRFSYGP